MNPRGWTKITTRGVRQRVDRIFRCLNHLGRHPDVGEFRRAVQTGLVSSGMRGRVLQRFAAGDDALFELAELLDIKGLDRTVEQPPVLDPPGQFRVAVTHIGCVGYAGTG